MKYTGTMDLSWVAEDCQEDVHVWSLHLMLPSVAKVSLGGLNVYPKLRLACAFGRLGWATQAGAAAQVVLTPEGYQEQVHKALEVLGFTEVDPLPSVFGP